MSPRPVVLAALLLVQGCDWIALAKGAATYETLAAGEAGNVVAGDSIAYATLGDSGIAVIDAGTGQRLRLVPPPAGMHSVDDLALADGLLFALDAREPGHLSALTLDDARRPTAEKNVVDVAVGPFSGVSAARGLAVVSGGTSRLSAWRFDERGALAGPIATADFGRGQPDVLVTVSGLLLASTHRWGPYFGVSLARLDDRNGALTKLSAVELPGAGFSSGGAKPANFPLESAQLGDSTFAVAHQRGIALLRADRDGKLRVDTILDVGGPAVNVDVRGNTAAVVLAGRHPAVVLFEAGGPRNILKRIALPPGTIPLGVALSSRTVIVAARSRGVLVLPR